MELQGLGRKDAVVERKRKRTTDSSIHRSRTKAVGKKKKKDRQTDNGPCASHQSSQCISGISAKYFMKGGTVGGQSTFLQIDANCKCNPKKKKKEGRKVRYETGLLTPQSMR